jgi:hypothetical protein
MPIWAGNIGNIDTGLTATTLTGLTPQYYWTTSSCTTTTGFTNAIQWPLALGTPYANLYTSYQNLQAVHYQNAAAVMPAELYHRALQQEAHVNAMQAQQAEWRALGLGRGPNLERHARRQQPALAAHPKPAQDRARELLLSHLTLEQRETFEHNKWFVVKGGKSGKLYRIRDGGHVVANIEVMRAVGYNDVDHRLCAHCDASKYPLGDHFLAQKLMLEFDEEAFLRIANRHAA